MRALKQGQGTGVFEPQDLVRPTHVFGPFAPVVVSLTKQASADEGSVVRESAATPHRHVAA